MVCLFVFKKINPILYVFFNWTFLQNIPQHLCLTYLYILLLQISWNNSLLDYKIWFICTQKWNELIHTTKVYTVGLEMGWRGIGTSVLTTVNWNNLKIPLWFLDNGRLYVCVSALRRSSSLHKGTASHARDNKGIVQGQNETEPGCPRNNYLEKNYLNMVLWRNGMVINPWHISPPHTPLLGSW